VRALQRALTVIGTHCVVASAQQWLRRERCRHATEKQAFGCRFTHAGRLSASMAQQTIASHESCARRNAGACQV
jgi:hypothetical protein